MSLPVRFLQDRDGRSVAYAAIGRGAPLVCDTGWVTHLQAFWTHAPYRRFFETLAQTHTVVLFDRPGVGLGDPAGRCIGLEQDVAVLEDLVGALGFDRVDLFGASQAAATMAAYAARNPRQVDRLILFGGYANGADLARPEVRDSLLQLVRTSWGLAAAAYASMFVADAGPEVYEAFARLTRAAASAEIAVERLAAGYAIDVRPLLAGVRAHSLVMHRRGDRAVRFELGRSLAATIPAARFVSLEGNAHIFYVGDVDAGLRAVMDFLGDRRRPPRHESGGLTGRETQVAQLVAEGLSNGEIAARLRISERTAESHLEHIRDKLGFRARSQIAAWVAEKSAG